MHGYWGQILRVDLSEGETLTEPLDEGVSRKLVGGSGLGAYYLYQEVGADVKATGPQNRLVFATGPFQGTNLPGSGKWSVISKSPANQYYGESAATSHWGKNLKGAGYDALVIQGRSTGPVYLNITEDGAEIVEAPDLESQDAYQVIDYINSQHGEQGSSVAAIGEAGENLVRYSCITIDKKSYAGRSGLGAVMGSKRLKGIRVAGSKQPSLAHESEVLDLQKELFQRLTEQGSGFRENGTPGYMRKSEDFGDLPIKNWQKGSWEEGNEKLGVPSYNEKILDRSWPCPSCPLGCHRLVEVEEPEKYKMRGAGPEYETLAMIGENCLIDNLEAVAKANDVCNRYSLDTISTGASVAFAMECYDKGYLSSSDVDGLDLAWGNADAALALIEKIGRREGIGDILADGVEAAAEEIHPDTKAFAVSAKGVELPAHDPRAFYGIAVNYATGVRGPGHERGNLQLPYQGTLLPELDVTDEPDRYQMDGTARLATKYQDWSSLWNSLVICRFQIVGGMTYTDMLEGLNGVTGWDLSKEESGHLAERIFQLQRLVNTKFGLTSNDDRLPQRIYEATGEGPHPDKVPEPLEPVLEEYYELRGWDEEGVPTKDTLDNFDLDEIITY